MFIAPPIVLAQHSEANVKELLYILEDEIRVYLSTEVWRLVKTRDHDSLKRRLRRAVHEAEKIRQVNSNQAQSNTGS